MGGGGMLAAIWKLKRWEFYPVCITFLQIWLVYEEQAWEDGALHAVPST